MISIALIFLLLLHLPSVHPVLHQLSRVHFRSTGVWWVTYYTTGFGSTRLYRWPWA